MNPFDVATELNDLRDFDKVQIVLTNRMGTSVFLDLFNAEVVDGRLLVNVDYEHST